MHCEEPIGCCFKEKTQLWAFDELLSEERGLFICMWLGIVFFHLIGHFLYCKSVNESFYLLLGGIGWAPMGFQSGGWAQCCPSSDKSHGTVCQVTSRQDAWRTEQRSSREATYRHYAAHMDTDETSRPGFLVHRCMGFLTLQIHWSQTACRQTGSKRKQKRYIAY